MDDLGLVALVAAFAFAGLVVLAALLTDLKDEPDDTPR